MPRLVGVFLYTDMVKRQIVLNTHHLSFLIKVLKSFCSLISTYCTISYLASRAYSWLLCHPSLDAQDLVAHRERSFARRSGSQASVLTFLPTCSDLPNDYV